MNLLRLSWAYMRRSGVATVMNLVLLALGVATITLLVLLAHELEERLNREARGVDLVVGAKGSPLQLILSGVYHVDVPTGNIPLDEVEKLRRNPLIKQVIPISLGDSFRGFRIVGTEPELITHYDARFAAGRVWSTTLEAVLGADVARASGLGIGESFVGTHGLGAGGEEHRDNPYRVVGILSPTGTVVDRLVLTPLASVWAVHEHERHEHHVEAGAAASDAHAADDHEDAADGAREVTLALVQYATPLAAASLPREIDKNTGLQAASPPFESARLLTVFGFGTDVIRGFAVLLIVASALGIFVALYRAMDERQYDVAIMRTLGASRRKVCAVLLLESLLLVTAGTVLGLLGGHWLVSQIGRLVPAATLLSAGAWHLLPEEAWIVCGAIGSGVLAALIPAWRAYRLDVAAVLARG